MRTPPFNTSRLACAAALLVTLAACGGGGGGGGGGFPILGIGNGSGTNSNPNGNSNGGAPSSGGETATGTRALSGVAATGAAFAGAAITVTDRTGATVCSTSTDAQGAYGCELPATAQPPFVVRAVRDDQALYSTTAGSGGTVNLTPLTTIVVAQLSPDGNPASLAGAIQTQPDTVTAATIRAQADELIAALKPLLDALGQAGIDLIAGALVANGTGQDKLLDSISVSVQPTGGSANIEITVKTLPSADGAPPVSISFNTASATPVLPAIGAADLADTPTPAAVAALFERLTACYALPLTQRVSTATSDSTAATGTAADVAAPACRTLFLGDDPATFHSNGYDVGRDGNNAGAFSGLFRPGATGVVFDRGNIEFARSNGDFVASYRQVDRNGNTDNDTLLVRNVGGTLKLVGNGYAYRASVRPYSEDREQINATAYSAWTTGYNISIDNRMQGGQPVLDRVIVTAPSGDIYTFVPQPGLSYLTVLQPDGVTPSASNIVRFASGYKNAATPGRLSEVETQLYFVAPQLSDTQIAALQNQSVWRMEFVPAGGSPGASGNPVQTYRTLSRAQSIAEVSQLKVAQLTPAMKAELASATSATGAVTFGPTSQSEPNNIDFSADGDAAAWTVPELALPPSLIGAFGRAPNNGPRFNDNASLAATQRKAVIYCSPQGQGDSHCNSANGVQYAQGTSVNSFELWVRNSRQVEISKKIGTYFLP